MKVDCPWEGCFKYRHKTTKSKLCKYNGKNEIALFTEALKKYLKDAYPENYGKLIIGFLWPFVNYYYFLFRVNEKRKCNFCSPEANTFLLPF